MTFELDTSGSVRADIPGLNCPVFWSDLTPFCQGYVEAMWQSVRELRRDAEDAKQINLDDLGFRHLAGDTLKRIVEDCGRFVTYSRDVCGVDGYEQSPSDGRWFWDARQRGEWSDKGYPVLTPFLSDEGLIFLKEVG